MFVLKLVTQLTDCTVNLYKQQGNVFRIFAIFGHFLDEDDTICVIFYILSYNLSSEKVDE